MNLFRSKMLQLVCQELFQAARASGKEFFHRKGNDTWFCNFAQIGTLFRIHGDRILISAVATGTTGSWYNRTAPQTIGIRRAFTLWRMLGLSCFPFSVIGAKQGKLEAGGLLPLDINAQGQMMSTSTFSFYQSTPLLFQDKIVGFFFGPENVIQLILL